MQALITLKEDQLDSNKFNPIQADTVAAETAKCIRDVLETRRMEETKKKKKSGAAFVPAKKKPKADLALQSTKFPPATKMKKPLKNRDDSGDEDLDDGFADEDDDMECEDDEMEFEDE